MDKKSGIRLAITATLIDLVYITLTVLFKQQLNEAGNVGMFFSYYLPFYLHFPFVLLFFGLNYWFMYFFLLIQTFVVFFLMGNGFGKNKKISIFIGVAFYLVLIGLAINATRSGM